MNYSLKDGPVVRDEVIALAPLKTKRAPLAHRSIAERAVVCYSVRDQ